MESTKKITFKSSDGEVFVVDKVVAAKFQAIKHLIETDCASEIPLHNVTSTILAMVIEYCKKHVEVNTADAKPSKDELKSWDANFLKVDQGTLFEIILAANYLNIESLLDLACENVAAMIRGKSPQEIRKTFNIENDFTQEDEEEILMENEWAFE